MTSVPAIGALVGGRWRFMTRLDTVVDALLEVIDTRASDHRPVVVDLVLGR